MAARAARFEAFRSRLRTLLLGPQLLAFMPALTLAGFWIGGEMALVIIALLLPVAFALAGLYSTAPSGRAAVDPATGLGLRSAAVRAAERSLSLGPGGSATAAALVVGLDDFPALCQRLNPRATDAVLAVCANRLVSSVRSVDVVVRLEGPRFAIVLGNGAQTDLEALILVSARIQREIELPVIVDAARIYVSASVGFCNCRSAPERSGEALLAAAEDAMADAAAHGAGMLRAYAPDIRRRAEARHTISDELPAALDGEQIRPWFQPQVSASSGAVTGFEVLARWDHPERGLVPPAEFLTTAADMGLMGRLGEVMLYQALTALRSWDACGAGVPGISMNFSGEELRNPMLVEKVRWELDRFGIAPDRLTVEVLETVIAQTENDTIVRNLSAFAALGCRIDLDDFGTGHASITSIKRFSVGRIKIDRSFVTQLDTDPEQRTVVGAILTMAGQLGLETLAEGVETPAEHRVLRSLGCDYLQGFGIARPMPAAEVAAWLEGYRRQLERPLGAAPPSPRPKPPAPSASAGKTA